MFLVDTLQHLGIDHHFKEQIDNSLNKILKSEFSSSSSLHEVALRFRLLRENGHWVSPDVFDKYKGEDGSFRKDITNEPRGLLSLYNATHLLCYGEPKLEEAMTFARQHLVSINGSLKSPLARQVKRAIHRALPRACKRVEALQYISESEEEEGHNPILLELAKLDFNLLQHVHLKELKDIIEWWKHFSGFIELSFIRDRVVESYTWAYVLYYEKGFEFQRSITTKMIVLITTLDDTYDIRATIQECRKLHEAIQRWDERAVSLLPEYLKKLYIELLRTFKNIEDEMPININYDIAYFKKARRKCKGDAASSVECYIHQHSVTGEEAIARIYELIEDEWRTLNNARFENSALLLVLKRITGLALSTSLFYDNRNDMYTASRHLHKTIESFFVKPILSG